MVDLRFHEHFILVDQRYYTHDDDKRDDYDDYLHYCGKNTNLLKHLHLRKHLSVSQTSVIQF